MSTVPRRPRPQPGDRAQTILTQTRGAHSGQGSSAAARPVTATRLNRQHNPPLTGGPVTVGDTTGFPDAVAIQATGGTSGTTAALAGGAVAVGVGAQATGDRSTALGDGSGAASTSAVAVGDDAQATAQFAVAVGRDSIAAGVNSVAIGKDAEADGTDSVALGHGAAAINDHEFALGNGAHIVIVRGELVIADGSTLYRLDATGGTLSLVAYP